MAGVNDRRRVHGEHRVVDVFAQLPTLAQLSPYLVGIAAFDRGLEWFQVGRRLGRSGDLSAGGEMHLQSWPVAESIFAGDHEQGIAQLELAPCDVVESVALAPRQRLTDAGESIGIGRAMGLEQVLGLMLEVRQIRTLEGMDAKTYEPPFTRTPASALNRLKEGAYQRRSFRWRRRTSVLSADWRRPTCTIEKYSQFCRDTQYARSALKWSDVREFRRTHKRNADPGGGVTEVGSSPVLITPDTVHRR